MWSLVTYSNSNDLSFEHLSQSMSQPINNLTTTLQVFSKGNYVTFAKYIKVSESHFKDSLELHGIKLIYDGKRENESL